MLLIVGYGGDPEGSLSKPRSRPGLLPLLVGSSPRRRMLEQAGKCNQHHLRVLSRVWSNGSPWFPDRASKPQLSPSFELIWDLKPCPFQNKLERGSHQTNAQANRHHHHPGHGYQHNGAPSGRRHLPPASGLVEGGICLPDLPGFVQGFHGFRYWRPQGHHLRG